MPIAWEPACRRRLLRKGAAALVALAIVAAWWAFLRPSSVGGPLTLVTVTGTSMQPRFQTGDLAVMRDAETYHRGDVVAFRAEVVPGERGAFVIHRVVGGGAASGYVLQGDNNDWRDPWHPTAQEVTGRLWFSVPGGGTVVRWLSRPVHAAALMAAVVAGLAALEPRRSTPRVRGSRLAASRA
jgi:signal peptidase I